MKYFFTITLLIAFCPLFAQTFPFEELFALKYKDSDDAISLLEDKGFEISGMVDDHMYFSCSQCEDGNKEAIRIVFELEKENGPNIQKAMVIEYALQNKENLRNIREAFKSSEKVRAIEKISATIEPKSDKFESAVEKSTYRCQINQRKEFFSFARFIPTYPIFKKADIVEKFGASITIQ